MVAIRPSCPIAVFSRLLTPGTLSKTSAERGRVWRIANPEQRNAVGEPVAYRLVPHGNVQAMASAYDFFSGRDQEMPRDFAPDRPALGALALLRWVS